jgi:hypothetical protein
MGRTWIPDIESPMPLDRPDQKAESASKHLKQSKIRISGRSEPEIILLQDAGRPAIRDVLHEQGYRANPLETIARIARPIRFGLFID